MKRRHLLSTLAVSALAAAMPGASQAQDAKSYPSKPIRIVVPFAPGGSSDVLARAIGQKLTVAWGQPVVIENKPGAGGNIGAENVARSAPDGYSLLMIDVGTITISPALFPKLGYDPVKDFAPITTVAFSPHALVVNPSVPANTAAELVAFAKTKPDGLDFANPGIGTLIQLAAEQFKTDTGIKLTQVPYKGGAQAVLGVMSGEVSMTLNGLLATLPHIKSGKLRVLAVTGLKRAEALPDVPTLNETILPGFLSGSWQGLLAPAGTPKEVVTKLNAAVVEMLQMPDMKQQLSNQGAEVVADTPEQFAAFIRNDVEKWGKVVRDSGIKAE
jgi:tripartite-type tricarboxylate transporter receptor subunit TctC